MRHNQLHDDLYTLGKDDLLHLRERIDTALSTIEDNAQPLPAEQACRLLNASQGVRYLDRSQLQILQHSFERWVEGSRNARVRRSRERVLLVFLVLRYTGAKLGEVLALDECTHLDTARCTVSIPHGPDQGREIPLPAEVMERIKNYSRRYGSCDDALQREPLFDLDPGFVRRKFSEQERDSGLPRELLNPSALRCSRGIELLQEGMPVRAVQALLGHSTTDLTAAYVQLNDDDLRQIIRQHCQREFGMETSARNTFNGRITGIVESPVMSEVTLSTPSGNEVVALITNQSREKLGLAEGRQATAMIKATWVILEKAETPSPTSARNAFPGVITDVNSDGVVAEVNGTLADGTPVCALVTAESFQKLGIGAGDSFIFMFKAMSVILS